MNRSSVYAAVALIVGVVLGHAGQGAAQEHPPSAAGDTATSKAPNPAAAKQNAQAPRRHLPPDATSQHKLALPGRTLAFQAIAGSIPLSTTEGELRAEIAYIAYTLSGADTRTRPVAFIFNGGPGTASAWLHIGLLGPWRLPLAGAAATPSAPALTEPNAETWLDFIDLVLIDPPGTGFSRVERGAPSEAGADGERRGNGNRGGGTPLWSVDGDQQALSEFISKWLLKHNRLVSPKVLVGESYGGFRVPTIARRLQTSFGVGVNTLIMISPALDMAAVHGRRDQPMSNVSVLPSLAAAGLEAKGKPVSEAAMREAESYAQGEFLTDLLRGPDDTTAVGRIVDRVARLTGLDPHVVRQYGGRLDGQIYRREANRAAGAVASPYDASVKGIDPDPTAFFSRADDPMATALHAPLTTAMRDLYATKLGWTVNAQYRLSNGEANRAWQWGNASNPPEAVSALRSALALDPRLVALVAHGYTDLTTPYFATDLMIRQIPDFGRSGRLKQITYPGGHMFYSRDESRQRFREDARTAILRSIDQPKTE